MTTIEEARWQILQAKQNVEQSKQNVAQAKQQDVQTLSRIEQLKKNLDSTAYLMKNRGLEGLKERQVAKEITIPQTQQQLSQRAEDISQYEQNIQQTEKNIAASEQSVAQAQSQIDAYNKEQDEWKHAEKLAGTPYAMAAGIGNSSLRKKIQIIEQGQKEQAKYNEQQKKLKDSGIKLVTDKQGNVVGYEDVKTQQSFGLNNVPEKYIPILKDVGFTFETKTVPQTQTQVSVQPVKEIVVPQGTVSKAPTYLEKVGKYGIVTATLSAIKKTIEKPEVYNGGTYRSYQSAETYGKAFSVLAESNPPVMLATGIESFTMKGGRQNIKNTQLQYESEGSSKPIAEIKSYAVPVTNIGFGLLGVSEISKVATSPIKKIVGLEKPILTKTDIIKPIILQNGEQVDVGRFILKQRTPSYTIEETTPLKQFFGMKPKVTTVPEKVSIAYTPDNIFMRDGKIIGNAYTIVTKPKSSYGNLYQILGEEKQVSPEAFNLLSKRKQFELNRLAEAKVGRPVPMKQTVNILGNGLEYSTGEGVFVKIAKITPKTKEMKFYPYGKRITQAETMSTANKVEVPEGSNFERYYTETGVKDVTKPFSRASGDLPVIKGDTFIMQPEQPMSDVSSNIIKTSTKLKPSIKSVQKLQTVQSTIAKEFPKVKSTKSTNQIVEPMLNSKFAKSGVVSSLETKTKVSSLKAEPIQMQPSKVMVKEKASQRIEARVTQTPKQMEKQFQPQQSRQESILNIKQNTLTKVREMLKTNQKTNLETKQTQKTVQKQGLRIQQKVATRTTPRETTKPKVRVPIIFVKPNSVSSIETKSLSMSQKARQAFDVFSRRKGKDILIAKELPKGLAEKFGSEYVTKTLAAAFKLKASGTTSKEDIQFKVPEAVFRPGKRDTSQFVQRKGGKEGGFGRLATGTELSEIKTFRRRKI